MHRRARSILRGEQGLSMILVLCIGALFVALSAALVYAASVLTANANRQLLEQEAYQLATSFSDVLEGELNNKDSSFAKFVNEQFMFSQSYGKDIYDLESQPFVFELMQGSTAAADGADSITITLRRRPGEDVDDLNLGGQGQYVTTDKDWQSFLRDWQSTDYKVIDLQLDVTVTAKKGGEQFSFTRVYDRHIHYPIDYYTIDGQTAHYNWTFGTNQFTVPGGSTLVIDKSDTKVHTIVPHYDTRQQDKTTITYTRGVKQNASKTQE